MQQTSSPVSREIRAADVIQQEVEAAINMAMQQNVARGQPAAASQAPLPPGTIVFTGNGSGENVRINVKNGNVVLTQGANTTTIPLNDVVPKGLVQMSWAFAACVIAVFVGWPIARAVARYLDRRGRAVRADNALEAQLQQRFDAMERNIDTVAVEMERLSEAQRFTSKLLEPRPAAVAASVAAAVAVPVDTNR